MSNLWYLEDEDSLSSEEKEIVSECYELCYLYASHAALRNPLYNTVITGLSYGLDAFDPRYMSHPAVNLCMHSQDLYYDSLHIKRALSENPGIQNVVLTIGYYSMFYDLSLSSSKEKCYTIYNALFNDVHNCNESIDDEGVIGYWLELHKDSVINYFGEQPEYYGKAIEREITNYPIYTRGGWHCLSKEERTNHAKGLPQKHNRHFEHLKTYEENAFLLASLFNDLSQKGINIYVVIPPFSPEYNSLIRKEYKQSILSFLNSCKEAIHYLDMNDLGIEGKEYFMDADHLNLRGAIEATRILDNILDEC
jgi:hypothetical protein